jgi:hypothetical protein
VFVLALDSNKGHVLGRDICRDRGLLPMLGNTRSSPHPSVVALGCLNVQGERGERQSCYSDRLSQRPSMNTAEE